MRSALQGRHAGRVVAGVKISTRRLGGFVAPALFALVAAGCMRTSFVAAEAPSRVKFLTDVQNGQLIDVKEGTRIVVRLEDRRDDCDWALGPKPARRILTAVRPVGDPALTGPGNASAEFAFDAVGPGITELELVYLPAANAAEPAGKFLVTVRVEAL